MANEINPKLVSQLLDLNRNIDKLSAEMRKSTAAFQSTKSEENTESEETLDDRIFPVLDTISKDLKKLNSQIEKIDFNQISEISKTFDPKAIKDAISGPLNSIFGNVSGKGIFGKILGNEKILGNFQTGGIAEKEGKYLVGENGPEIVKLPAGSSVIPINIKDLIEGIAKVPELANLAKSVDINAYGNPDRPSVLLGKAEDVNNRISLIKLQEKYENALDEQESKDEKEQNPIEIKRLRDQNDIITSLMDLVKKEVSKNVQGINDEQSKLFNNTISKGFTPEENKFLHKSWEDILNQIPESERNSLSVAKAHLLATKMVLDYRNKSKEIENKPEVKTIPDNLKDLTKPPAIPKMEGQEAPTENKKGLVGSIINQGKMILGKEISNISGIPSLATPGLVKNVPDILKTGIPKISDVNFGKFTEKLNIPEFKKSITSLGTIIPKKGVDLGNEFKSLNNNLTNIVKPQIESIKEKAKEIVPEKTENPAINKVETKKAEQAREKISNDMTADLADIKILLSRIAMALDGPLEVTPIDHPFRPDTRKI